MPPTIFVTSELTLQPKQQIHAAEFLSLLEKNRDRLKPHFDWVAPIQTLLDAQRFLFNAERFNQGGQQLNTFITFNGKIIGSISFALIQKNHRKAELGYWIDHDFEGKGFVTQSAKALIRYGFEALQLNRIFIRTATDNAPSRALAQRLEMYFEGILRQDFFLHSHFVDLEIYSLLKQDWNG